MSDSWHSYPSIFALGHRAIKDLLTVPVTVEEKVDGSQFSFGVFPAYDHEGYPEGATVLRCRSKGCVLNIDAPEKMFTQAVETAKRLAPMLHVGWTYRGEYLAKPAHNALAYARIPSQHIILFDINDGHESYLDYAAKSAEASRLGLEECTFESCRGSRRRSRSGDGAPLKTERTSFDSRRRHHFLRRP